VILNTNSLPFPLSPGLKAIILQHIADSFMACVLNFHSRNHSADNDDGSRPVEIAVDTDGSLIHISSFRCVGTPRHHSLIAETHFDFSRNEAHFLGTVTPLNKEHERFKTWETTFVDDYLQGNYKVEVSTLLELEEIVTAN
jgi:hypothetical protein